MKLTVKLLAGEMDPVTIEIDGEDDIPTLALKAMEAIIDKDSSKENWIVTNINHKGKEIARTTNESGIQPVGFESADEDPTLKVIGIKDNDGVQVTIFNRNAS